MPTAQMRVAHHASARAIRWWFRLEVTGRDQVPGGGGVLLAANHRSYFDHFGLFAACPRPMRFLGKQELARGPAGRFNVAMGMVPVERGSADVAAIRTVAALLRAGEVVGVFPEGTRSRTGELHRFRSGASRIAATSGRPVVPVGIVGSGRLWPDGDLCWYRRPARGGLRVAFGPPLAPPAAEPRARRAFTAALREAVAHLCEQPLADGFAPIESPAAPQQARQWRPGQH